jgi:hypothetical protein
MHIFHRQGNDTVFWDVFMWTDDASYVPTDADYEGAIPGGGIGTPTRPEPEDGAMLSDTWVSLNWRPGDFAVSHDVYFGESFDDVNSGSADTFRGNHASDFFVVGFPGMPYPEGLVPGTTYYWRIDEVNDADPNSPWRGPVWSFWLAPTNAYAPSPADGAQYIGTEPTLTWETGFGAKLHNVVFGDNFDDVSSAPTGVPQADATHAPGVLEKGKTYYWRVDQLNPPTTVEGDVWSFTTLPDIPVGSPDLVGWWKLDEGAGSVVIDWSGHDNHGTFQGNPQWTGGYDGGALGLSGSGDNVYAESAQLPTGAFTLALWFNPAAGLGSDSSRQDLLYWQVGNGRPHLTFNRSGTGEVGLWPNVGGDFDGPLTTTRSWAANTWYHVTATFDANTFKIYVNGNQEDLVSHPGMHEDASGLLMGCRTSQRDYFAGNIDDVRLYNRALTVEEIQEVMKGDTSVARHPNPPAGSTPNISQAATLTWSAGDNAAEHDVYFGTDEAAVAGADASDTTGVYRGRQPGASYSTAADIEWGGGPYYWRVDEFNTDSTIGTGWVWSFSVADYLTVDDFESYNDIDPPDDASNRIFDNWIDGFGTTTNGALVGNDLPPYAETTVVHSGAQALVYSYDNNLKTSEATLTLVTQRDWTEEGVTKLSLWFQGDAANAAERMLVALNGTSVVYHDDPAATQITRWTEWLIDLTAFAGVNLANVDSITIGFGTKNSPAAGGTGTMYFDDIRLLR